MKTAIIIIAICEVIRIVQNSLQLTQLFASRSGEKRCQDAYIKSLDNSEKNWIIDLAEKIKEEKDD